MDVHPVRPSDPAVAYEVTYTRLDSYEVEIGLSSHDGGEEIYARGARCSACMTLQLEIGGTSGEWDRPVQFQRRSSMSTRLRAMDRRAADLMTATSSQSGL